jgi:hypothetical protein
MNNQTNTRAFMPDVEAKIIESSQEQAIAYLRGALNRAVAQSGEYAEEKKMSIDEKRWFWIQCGAASSLLDDAFAQMGERLPK